MQEPQQIVGADRVRRSRRKTVRPGRTVVHDDVGWSSGAERQHGRRPAPDQNRALAEPGRCERNTITTGPWRDPSRVEVSGISANGAGKCPAAHRKEVPGICSNPPVGRAFENRYHEANAKTDGGAVFVLPCARDENVRRFSLADDEAARSGFSACFQARHGRDVTQ